MSTLVFLEHHGVVDPEGRARRARQGRLARPGHGRACSSARASRAWPPRPGRYGAKRVFVADDASPRGAAARSRASTSSPRSCSDQGFDNVLFARLGAGVRRRRRPLGPPRRRPQLGPQRPRGAGRRAWSASAPPSATPIRADVGWSAEPRLGLIRAGSFEPVETAARPPSRTSPSRSRTSRRRPRWSSRRTRSRPAPRSRTPTSWSPAAAAWARPRPSRSLEELAAALGGAVASTRAVVDSGWYPYPTQIGQTGKVVSPKVYLGFGVSGAIQHKVGMQTSQTIIAVNKDAQRADLRVQRPGRRGRPATRSSRSSPRW